VSAPLFVHDRERHSTERSLHVRATFSRRHMLDDDFEVIPTPGHTSGATAYLWDTGAERLLFTGDTIYLRDGEWVGAVLDRSDREAYLRSLDLIRSLDFDVLVPWAASAGDPPYAGTNREDAAARIDAMIERIRAGADS
jgi:glyoxylase-like metal-dependent hydrolase (beta-lactamase superfamily II)